MSKIYQTGKKKAVAARPRNCTLCRECIRDPEWAKKISLRRVKNHFIFSIESVGILHPKVIFEEAIKVLNDKVAQIQTELEKAKATKKREAKSKDKQQDTDQMDIETS